MGTLSNYQKNYLLRSGFLKTEINQIDKAHFHYDPTRLQPIDLKELFWADLIHSRQIKKRVAERLGWNREKYIGSIIRQYRRNKSKDVFDEAEFIYLRGRKPRKIADYPKARANNIKRRNPKDLKAKYR